MRLEKHNCRFVLLAGFGGEKLSRKGEVGQHDGATVNDKYRERYSVTVLLLLLWL